MTSHLPHCHAQDETTVLKHLTCSGYKDSTTIEQSFTLFVGTTVSSRWYISTEYCLKSVCWYYRYYDGLSVCERKWPHYLWCILLHSFIPVRSIQLTSYNCCSAMVYHQTSNINRILLGNKFLSLRCSWSIVCRRCFNYIFIPDLTPGFNGLGRPLPDKTIPYINRVQPLSPLWHGEDDNVWYIFLRFPITPMI